MLVAPVEPPYTAAGLLGLVFVWLLTDLSVQHRGDVSTIRVCAAAIAGFDALPALFVAHPLAAVASIVAVVGALLQVWLVVGE